MQVNEAPRKDGRRRRRRRRRGSAARTGGAPATGHSQNRTDPDDDRVATHRQPADNGDRFTPFNLFASYHLGVTKDNGYKFQSMPEVARRFGVDVQSLKERLIEWKLDSETLRRGGFDSEMGQLDIRVAPEGISRRELARSMWLDLGRPDPDDDVYDPDDDFDGDDDDYEDDEDDGK